MEAIKIEVNGNVAQVTEKPLRITSGTVGLPVEFTFDSLWDGLRRVAVFQACDTKRDMPLTDSNTVVPMEVTEKPDVRLNIGVYGVNEDGSVAIPTIWTNAGKISEGAVPSGNLGTDIGTAKEQYDAAVLAAEKAVQAARAVAQSEQNIKGDAVRAAEAAGSAEAARQRTEEIADSVGSPVSYKQQTLDEVKKVQARENIGVSPYYHTAREDWEIGDETNSDRYANAEFIWSLYDDLQNKYGADVVQKKEVHNNDGTFTNYVYEISTGEYSTVGVFAERYGADYQIKKPKYLILNGIHGNERKTCLSTYRFIRDVLRGHNVPQSFREGVTLCVMPVGNPSGVNAFTRANDNGVNINRNFDWNWVEGSDSNGACGFGETAESEKETQAIANWLKSYTDEETGKTTADLFIDFHNSGHINEQVLVIGLADAQKKIAMRGIDRIIPYWRDVIGYPKQMEAITTEGVLVEKDVIYSYTIAAEIPGVSYGYAQEVLGINSLAIEASVFYGKFSDYNANLHSCPPETVAMGAEALGNILLEFYEQSFMSEVTEDMKAIDDKLETLLASVHSGFRMESGVYEVTQDQAGTGSVYFFNIPCSSGAKLFFIQADDTEVIDTENNRTTYAVILNTTQSISGPYWLIGALGSYGEQVGYKKNRGLISYMGNASYSDGSMRWTPREAGMPCDNTKGIQIATYGLKAGKYNWAAYYWNEQEE